MATHIASANGNLTATSTWKDASTASTCFLNSEAGNTAVTTSFVASSAFTPGAVAMDGIAVKIASRAASPTGTISFQLFHGATPDAGTLVTVNVSDLPTCTATSGSTTPVGTAEGGWFLVTFASFTPAGATAYTLQVKSSSSSQVNLWTDGTGGNWSRMLRLNANTGSVTTGDDFVITKEWTAASTGTARSVTMDSTAATDYGNNTLTQVTPSLAITQGGTLTYNTGIAAILRQSGYVVVYNGGTLNVGVTGGSEIGRSSSAQLQFDCTADGDFGLVARIGSTVSMAGLSRTNLKNISQTKLNANASAGATSITVVDDTGWLNGDVLCFAPTSQTSTEFESKAATGNATATTIAVSALTNAHSGTSPTQGEVGLLTRNVVFKAVTANVVTFFYIGATAVVNCSWTDFQYIGTNATGKRGAIVTTTGSASFDFCTFRDCDTGAHYWTGAAISNISLTNSIIYNCNIATAQWALNIATATSGTWTINNCMFCGGAAGGGAGLVTLSDIGGTFTNNSLSGESSSGSGTLYLAESGALGTFTGNQIHSNTNFGVNIVGVNVTGTLSGDVWRCSTTAIVFSSSTTQQPGLTLKGNLFGNTTGIAIQAAAFSLILDTVTINGDTTFACTNAISINSSSVATRLYLYSCNLSTASGIKTACTNDFNFSSQVGTSVVSCDNTISAGTNIYAGIAALTKGLPFLQFENFGQTANDNRSYIGSGASTPHIIKTNSGTVYSTNPLSEEMQPGSASIKLPSESILVATRSGQVATVTVQVQKNGTYNGAAPRLILKRQDSMNVTSDTVKATFSAAANTWQAQVGSSPTAPQDGVYEFIIDCDGTAGSVFVGDTSGNRRMSSMQFWFKGLPAASADAAGNDPATLRFWFQAFPDPWQLQIVNATVNLTGVTATGAAHAVTVTFPGSAAVTGVTATAHAAAATPRVSAIVAGRTATGAAHAVTPSISVTAAKASSAAIAGTVTNHGDANVHVTGVIATGFAANPPLHIDSNVPVTGVTATAAVNVVIPTEASPTILLPVFSIMRNVPVAANGDMSDAPVPAIGIMIEPLPVFSLMRNTAVAANSNMSNAPLPAIGAMTNVVAISSLMRSVPVAAIGSMSNTPVATTGTLLAA